MLIDTHCHLDFGEFNSDREGVIERAKKAGVGYIINIGSSLDGSRKSVQLAAKYNNVFASVGIHPHHAELSVSENPNPFPSGTGTLSRPGRERVGWNWSEIEALAKSKKVVAIGEVGLDYYSSSSINKGLTPKGSDPYLAQKELFIKFIELSKKLQLPLIIHNRDAHSDTLDILKNTCKTPIKGVMHCFSGDEKVLRDALEMGLFISFTCNLTFKNAKGLRELVKSVPLERLLLETDAPFLAPEAYRGKRNEPAYITELRDMISGILNLSKDEIERTTTENAVKLFGLKI